MAKLNAEVDTVTSGQYRAHSYPTIMVLQKDGTEIDRLVGYCRAPQFIEQVENYLAGRNTLASMEAEIPAKGSDPEFTARLADKYFEHGLYEQARTQYLKFVEFDPQNRSGRVDDALYTLARMSRKVADYTRDRKYAQMIIDRYPDSDMFRPAHLEVAGALRRSGDLREARARYLDFAKRFPDDEDAPWAREQADTLAVKIASTRGKGA